MPLERALGILLGAFALAGLAVGDVAAQTAAPCHARVLVDVEGGSVEEKILTALVVGEDDRRTIPAPGEATISWPAGESRTLQVRAKGFWSAPEVLQCATEPEPETVRLRLYPTGRLLGKAVIPEKYPAPESLEAHFQPAPSTEGPSAESPRGHVSCDVEMGERLSCEVPRGALDLRFRHPGFAVVYRWGVEAREEPPTSLDPIELVPGASMAGFVVVESHLVSPETWVELRPDTAGRPGPNVRKRLDAMEMRTAPNDRGFFQFHGLPPGTYTVRAGADSFVPVSLSPIRVVEGKESFLREPLRLAPPVPLHVVVTPPATPEGKPWKISLYPVPDPSGVSEGGFRGLADTAGNWSRDHLAPGEYTLTVESERGRWARQDLVLDGLSPFHEIVLDALEVEGVVRSGETPVEAVVWLGARKDEERLRVETDSGGMFDAALPRPGDWPVALTLGTSQYLSLEPVRVEAPEDGGPARIEIEIPDTRLAGEVVDGRDEPVEGARVEIFARNGRRDLTVVDTLENGEFEVLGLPPGDYSMSALLPDRSSPIGRSGSSDPVILAVEDGQAKEDVRLVLHRFETVRGRIVGPSGPVQGAMVVVRPETTARWTPAVLEDVVTGPTGTFQVTVPEHTIALSLVVVSPGLGTRLLRVPLDESGNVEVSVPATVGTLYLKLDDDLDPTSPPHVHAGGTWAPLFLLQPRQVATAEGPAWVVPRMAPDTYVLCSGAFVNESCSRGILPPGGELILEKPEPSVSDGST